jgi:hypothetical protein
LKDVSLICTIYEPYRYLTAGTINALREYWPKRPSPIFADGDPRLWIRILNGLRQVKTDLAVVMHEDYRLCGPVKQDRLDECVLMMQNDPSVISCSLTWEPIDKTPYKDTKFEELPVGRRDWPYSIGFQMRVWRRRELIRILEAIPATATHFTFEGRCGEIFQELLYPQFHAVTYPIASPPNPAGFVDQNDKSEWIIPYDNIYHGREKVHPEYTC